MTLVLAFSGLVHQYGCRSAKRVYKVVAPSIPLEEIAEFLRVRKLVGCGSCLREYRERSSR